MMSAPNLSSSSTPTRHDDPQTQPPQHDWLVSWVPSESPQRWLGINALAALYSCILALVLVFVADDDDDEGGGGPKEMMLAKHSYLIYDWILSFVWVLEITLTVWYSYIWKNNKPQQDSSSSSRFSPSVWHILELLVAVYFAMSSIYFLERQWDDPNIHDMTDMFVDILINIVAYGYMTFEVWKTWKQQQNNEPGGHNNHSSSVNDGYILATDDSKRRYGSLATDGPAEGRPGDGEVV